MKAFWLSMLIVTFGIDPALAQDHHHPPQDEAIHQRFYKTWMMPDARHVSCCHDQDCAPAETQFRDGQWFARKVGETGDFTPVPDRKIERDRDSPDGRSHLCGRPFGSDFSVFCFIAGAGG
jgi:hypothetical protein